MSFKIALRLLRRTTNFSTYPQVPQHLPCTEDDVKALKEFIDLGKNILVLTGAGISTESGLPDYRSKDVGVFDRKNYKPIQYQDFLKSRETRKRYWARNFAAWPTFSSIVPNATHRILKNMEDQNIVRSIITQNVDRLHTKAGSRNVIELHGSGYTVVCLGCDFSIDRHDFQKVLQDLNPHLLGLDKRELNPDGDVAISQEEMDSFKEAKCSKCGGILKPDIVFFGDNVPALRLKEVNFEVDACDSLLILGTSLTVYSSYRIAMRAHDALKPIALVNIGPTRADNIIPLKISARCGDLLPKLFPE